MLLGTGNAADNRPSMNVRRPPLGHDRHSYINLNVRAGRDSIPREEMKH